MSSLTPRGVVNGSSYATIEGTPVAGSSPFGSGFPPGGLSEPPKLRLQIVRSLRMHRYLALAVAGLVAGALLVLAAGQKRRYQAESLVYVEPIVAPRLNDQMAPGFDAVRYDSYLQQQILTVTRPDTLVAALHTLPPDAWRLPNENEQSAVARLQASLQVERVLTSYQIAIRLTASDPEKAAAVVNAVTNAYLQGGRKDELTEVDQREQLLGDERQRIKDELDTDRKEQAALGTSLGVANPVNEQGNPFDAQTASLRAELAAARQAHDVAAAQLSSMGTDQQGGLSAAAAESTNTDAGLSALKASVNARRATLESDKAGLTPSNPRYQQDQDEIADLDRTLDAMALKVRDRAERNIQEKLRAQLESTAQVEARLNGQLAQETAKATGAGPKIQRATEIAADIQRLTQRYGIVDNALRELQLQTGGTGMAHLALAAAVPASPQPSKRGLLLLMALPFGLLAGTSAAVIARARDRRIFIGGDLEEASGFAPMAVLPALGDVPERVYSEYVLRLAAAVEGAYRTASARTFVLTPVSAKTHAGDLVQALAHKLEDLRLKVQVIRSGELLVTSAETMEYRAQTAATLPNGLDLDQVLRMQQAGESIASSKLDRMKGENDLVLIDAAPVLHSAETEYAARCADATILVVESGVTLSTELKEAATLLSRLQVSGVGAVLEELHLDDADEAFKAAVSVVEQRRLEGVVDHKIPLVRREERVEARTEPGAAVNSPTKPMVAEAKPEPVRRQAVTPGIVKQEPVVQAVIQPEFARPATVHAAEQPIRQETEPEVAPEPRIAAVPVQTPLPEVATTPKPEPPAEVVLRPVAKRTLGPKSWAQDDVPIRDVAADLSPVPQRVRFVAEHVPELVPEPQRASPKPLVAAAAAVAEPDCIPEPVMAMAAAAPLAATMAGAAEVVNEVRKPSTTAPAIALREVAQTQQLTTKRSPEDEDPRAVGRFVGEKDRIGAVPSYTRSKIRRAFKEQEVNSKTTWFSKLFRGDPPASFRIVPEEDENEDYATARPAFAAQQSEEPPDPELQQLLRRINSREHELRREQTKPPAPAPAPIAPAPAPIAPAAAQTVPVAFARTPQPGATFAPPASPQPGGAPGRLPRPLSFQQLTGEAPIDRPSASRAAAAPPFEPARVQASVPAAPEPASEIPLWPAKESPAKAAPAFVHSAPPLAEASWNFVREPEPVPAVHSTPPAPRVQAAESEVLEPVHSAPVQPPLPGPSVRLEAQLAAHAARVPDPTSDPAPSPRNYRLDQPHDDASEAQPEEFIERRAPAPEPSQTVEAIVQHPRRRSTDQQGDAAVPGLTRRWALLSQFEPDVSDPLPAARRSHQKTDVALPPLQNQLRPEEG